MTSIPSNQAGKQLDHLIQGAAASHEPVMIAGSQENAVLLSEDDWRSIQETLYLLSVPGMRESIRKGMGTPVEECDSEPGW